MTRFVANALNNLLAEMRRTEPASICFSSVAASYLRDNIPGWGLCTTNEGRNSQNLRPLETGELI
jgi:hypothetical protein